MKQAITIRLDPELLAMAKQHAKEENRTLTNFLETALKDKFGKINTTASGSAESRTIMSRRSLRKSSNAKQ